MLSFCLHNNGPTVIRYPRGSGEGVQLDPDFRGLKLGEGELLQAGKDVLLLPIGNRVYPALKAVELV